VGASERTALAEAQEELASAQAAVDRLRKDVADNQKQAQQFATHLNDYKAMREDLDHLEGMHRAALDQLAKLQASERERAPRVQLLEAATASQQPWRPDYQMEAAFGVGAALAFGLFATWFIDFIVGPSAQAPTFMQYSWAPAFLGPEATITPRLLHTSDLARLPAPEPAPRELTDAEIAALVAAATEDARLVAVALLMGLSAEEIVPLRWDEIDFAAGVIRLGDEAARIVPLDEPMRSLIVARRQQPDAAGTILRGPDGNSLTLDEVARLVLFAAYDAGLDRPQEVTADALRYTYLSFLLRQGIRAADFDRIVGRVPQTELVAYMQLHSPRSRRPIEQIERLLPSIRELAAAGSG
jgi:polysaccharide biosynthesis transport protein